MSRSDSLRAVRLGRGRKEFQLCRPDRAQVNCGFQQSSEAAILQGVGKVDSGSSEFLGNVVPDIHWWASLAAVLDLRDAPTKPSLEHRPTIQLG